MVEYSNISQTKKQTVLYMHIMSDSSQQMPLSTKRKATMTKDKDASLL